MGVVAPVVAQGTGNDLHAQRLDGLHLLRHQTQGEIQQLGGGNIPPLYKAVAFGRVELLRLCIECVGDGAVNQDIAGVPLVQHDHILPVEPLGHRVCYKIHRLRAARFHQYIKTVIAIAGDLVHKGRRVLLHPGRVLHDLVHQRCRHGERGVLHEGGQTLLRQPHTGDSHIPELLQPPRNILLALFGQQLQFVVVKHHVVSLVP